MLTIDSYVTVTATVQRNTFKQCHLQCVIYLLQTWSRNWNTWLQKQPPDDQWHGVQQVWQLIASEARVKDLLTQSKRHTSTQDSQQTASIKDEQQVQSTYFFVVHHVVHHSKLAGNVCTVLETIHKQHEHFSDLMRFRVRWLT